MPISTLSTTSLQAQGNLASTRAELDRNIQHLSSGFRITSASDDAAGLAISEHLSSRSGGNLVAARNVNDAITMTQTAESALAEVDAMMKRMRELAAGGGSAAVSTDRQTVMEELDRIMGELGVGRGTQPPAAAAAGAPDFATAVSQVTGFDAAKAAAGASGVSAAVTVDDALERIDTTRAALGAMQDRLRLAIGGDRTGAMDARARRLEDVDIASETAAMTRAQVLSQPGTAMLAQANQVPGGALALLR